VHLSALHHNRGWSAIEPLALRLRNRPVTFEHAKSLNSSASSAPLVPPTPNPIERFLLTLSPDPHTKANIVSVLGPASGQAISRHLIDESKGDELSLAPFTCRTEDWHSSNRPLLFPAHLRSSKPRRPRPVWATDLMEAAALAAFFQGHFSAKSMTSVRLLNQLHPQNAPKASRTSR